MSDVVNLHENLTDNIVELYNGKKIHSPIELFTRVCRQLQLDICTFYKEDIINLGLYACQIILNDKFYLKVGSGNTTDMAYQNTVIKFVNLCLKKRNIKYKFPEYDANSFYNELKDSIDNMDLSNLVISILSEFSTDVFLTAHLSKINSINYQTLKKKFIEMDPDIDLSENYRNIGENVILCSIVVNKRVLLQQGEGKNDKEALENTVTAFFKAYEIIPSQNFENVTPFKGTSNKEEILTNLTNLFNEKKKSFSSSQNYWDLIQECVKILDFDLNVTCGMVKINNVVIVNINNEHNEYVANILAGKQLIDILSKTKKKINLKPSAQLQLQSKANKVYGEEELDKIMKTMVTNAHKEYSKDERQNYWNVLNREFIKNNYKVEPKYEFKGKENICTLIFCGWDIITGSGFDKNTCRDAASRNLVDKYVSPK